MPKVNIRVTDEIKARFKAKAESQNMTESECFREWVLNTKADYPVSALAEIMGGDHKLKYLSIRLPEWIIDRIKPLAEKRSMKISRWVGALVQAHLITEPVLTKTELRAVYEATVQLTRAGTNLNQIAKSLNEHYHPGDPHVLKAIKSVSKEIKELKETIKALQIASNRSWQ
jgi:predicted DNA-binding protein